jgi:hypothetical protein
VGGKVKYFRTYCAACNRCPHGKNEHKCAAAKR